jgi:hypothetical protein
VGSNQWFGATKIVKRKKKKKKKKKNKNKKKKGHSDK